MESFRALNLPQMKHFMALKGDLKDPTTDIMGAF